MLKEERDYSKIQDSYYNTEYGVLHMIIGAMNTIFSAVFTQS